MKIFSILLLILSPTVFAEDALELLGERLFRDGRFSKNFFDASEANVNQELPSGVKEKESVSCFTCHRVDQDFESMGLMRGYNDNLVTTPIPYRVEDGLTHTLRNTPTLIGIGSAYAFNRFSHSDGEMSDHRQTVLGNFTGRNMGWLPEEKNLALAQIIKVIKEDLGEAYNGAEFGGAYTKVFLGIDPSLPEELRLPEEWRLDVTKASETEIMNLLEECVDRYMNGLDFAKDETTGFYSGSPYDAFLKLNSLPLGPEAGESIADYTVKLRNALSQLESPQFVPKVFFKTHKKEIGFGETEWKGLKMFFNLKAGQNGMCINCHLPPLFSDQQFHNIGTTQMDYDNLHGVGSFMKLQIPESSEDQNRPSFTREVDLGMWNFYGRNTHQTLTNYINGFLCGTQTDCLSQDHLSKTLARFKTPTLRNLGHSEPYMHNGKFKDLKETITQYKEASELMRAGVLRNGAPQLRMMTLVDEDIESLDAFLNSLNEEYE
jgi:cytochrome c peroxidase